MSNEVAIIPVEEKVEQVFKMEIVKVLPDAEAVIDTLKEKYMSIKVTDKASFKKAEEARKDVKNVRIVGEKICEAAKRPLENEKKQWIKKGREWSEAVGAIEEHLEKQTDEWKLAEQKRKEEEARKAEEERIAIDKRLLERQQELNKMGVLFADNNYMLGDVRYDYNAVRDSDDEVFANEIVPAFRVVFEQHEAERLVEEQQRKEAEEKRLQEEELLRQEQEKLRLEREEFEKQQAEFNRQKAEREEKIWRGRLAELTDIGWNGEYAFDRENDTESVFTLNELITLSEDEFSKVRDRYNEIIAQRKHEAEKKSREEEERQRIEKEKANLKKERAVLLYSVDFIDVHNQYDLAEMSMDDWNKLYEEKKRDFEKAKHEEWLEQERIKKEQEEERKKAELAEMTEGERWRLWKKEVAKFLAEVPEFNTKRYAAMSGIAREKLSEILSLKAEKFAGK